MAEKTQNKPADTKPAAQKAAEPAGKPSLEKKLTTKIVVGGKVHGGTVEDGPVQLYSIIGICSGIKTGESQYGGWVGFTGQFEATRFKDGARFIAPVAFIPEPASGMMLAAIQQAERKAAETGDVSVRFAFIVGAKASDKAAGFEYTIEPVMSASQNDALSELRALIAPKVPAITQQ